MNIMQVLPDLEVGGVERGTVDLARYLTLNAHKAVVVSGGGKLVKKLDEVGARHYTLPIGRKNPFIMLLMVFKLCEIIKRENIDIIHARSRVPALTAFLASRLTLKAFVTTAHGQYKKHLMSYVMGWGKSVIVANSVMARYIMENFGVRPDKIKIVPRGVDIRKFAFRKPEERKHKEFTIGMISRVTPIKGHLDFIKAVSVLARSISKLRVYIVGKKDAEKADYVRQMELLTRRLALNNIVEFLSETEDVPEVLSMLDVLVSASSEQEAFGRIIIEAQSAGIPCVATKIGGIVDIIEDGVTGLLCEPANPQDMASKIMRLYKDMELRNFLAANARKAVEEKYNLNKMMQATLNVYEETIKQTRILVIKISSLGDVILSVPSLRAVREKYPEAVIKVLVDLKFKDALKNSPYIDDLIVCDFKYRDKGIRGLLRIGGMLKNEDFDIVIDFQNNKRSHILSFLSCAALRYGYDNGKFSFLLNRKVKDTGVPMDPVEHQMKVLALMGISDVKKELTLSVSDEDKTWVEQFLKDNWIKPTGPFACLHLESSPRWLTKRWPVEYYAKVAGKLAEKLSMRVVVTGQNADDEQNRAFFKLAKGKPVSAVAKTTLGRLIALIEKASVLITSDTAPMHIASSVNTPFIALFGPTDPKRHAPPAKKYKVIKKEKECSPCYKPTCDRGYVCMKAIPPDEVFEAVQDMLNTGKTT